MKLESAGSGALDPPPLQTSLLRMQVNELLEEQTPNYESRTSKIQDFLGEVQRALASVPSRDALTVPELEKAFDGRRGTKIPFPDAKPPTDALHRYRFSPPKSIETIGSFPLETGIRHVQDSYIDMAVIMPQEMVEEKDYLNYRYIHKKAYYLACLADSLRKTLGQSADLHYSFQDENELQPCLILAPRATEGKARQKRERVRLLVGLPSRSFRNDRLLPWSICIRESTSQQNGPSSHESAPLPIYNGTITAETSSMAFHKLLKAITGKARDFRDAVKLIKVWLRQRFFSASIHKGGFGGFEAACYLAFMIREGSASAESDAFQLFDSFLRLLVRQDLVRKPWKTKKNSDTDFPASFELHGPVLYDTETGHNLLYKMSLSSYYRLRNAARTTLEGLAQPEHLRFRATFITKLNGSLLQYDHVFEGHVTSPLSETTTVNNSLYRALSIALGDRVNAVDVSYPQQLGSTEWNYDSTPPLPPKRQVILVGLQVDPMHVARQVDLGPSIEDKHAAQEFRSFWGSKAELRRFANGSIRESVAWPAPSNDEDILRAIVSFLCAERFHKHQVSLTYAGPSFSSLLPSPAIAAHALHPFAGVEQAFAKLQQNARTLIEEPLKLRHISASASGLRYGSETAGIPSSPGSSSSLPHDVVIQFESSVRWPEEMAAIQHTKVALLSKISELLRHQNEIESAVVGLENTTAPTYNRAFLDVVVQGYTFRLRIHHDYEASHLQRVVKDKAQPSKTRETAADAFLSHKRTFVHSPKHTQAVRDICARNPLVSSTMRLFKLWISSHLLSSHFCDELLELLVIHTFSFPYPHNHAGSLRSAFLKTLFFIAKWDWQNEPLLVNFSQEKFPSSDETKIMTQFQAWRQIDPQMHRVTLYVASNIEDDGTVWTHRKPSIVAVNRLVALARAACDEIAKPAVDLHATSLFATSVLEFDFVIYLRTFKELRANAYITDVKAGQLATLLFLEELETVFSDYIVFFYGSGYVNRYTDSSIVIGGLWLPRTAMREWKVSSSWSSVPMATENADAPEAHLDRLGVLRQIALLGGELVSRIEPREESR